MKKKKTPKESTEEFLKEFPGDFPRVYLEGNSEKNGDSSVFQVGLLGFPVKIN